MSDKSLFSKLKSSSSSSVKPRGWLREFLERQRDGMSGHYKELGYPFDSCLWAGEIENIHLNELFYPNDPEPKTYQTWWPYEQCAYLLDALVRLGILLDDKELIELFQTNLEYVLGTADANNRMGGMAAVENSEWPMAVFFRAVAALQSAKPSDEVIEAFHRHYTALSVTDMAEYFRNITTIEGMLQVAGWTGDSTLIEKAEAAWQQYNLFIASKHLTDYYDEIGTAKLSSGERVVTHGVTGSEEFKLPVLLYMYTGKQTYLDSAITGMEKLLEDHLLPTGVPSSEEYFSGTGATRAYEGCVITDFTWTLGYFLSATGEGRWGDVIEKAIFNALPGSITKDFTAMQYLSSGNQVITDGFAHKGSMLHGTSSWRQYRGNHFPQCCPANIQRAMPNYLLNMWKLNTDGAPVAAMYGPSEFSFDFSGQEIKIIEETEYPFEDMINFRFEMASSMEFPFSLRIPAWCDASALRVNDKEISCSASVDGFMILKRVFNPGDVVALQLPMNSRFVTDRQNNLTVERGPLVYSYAVPSTIEREESNSRFSPLRITPVAPWNYAVAEDAVITEQPVKASGYPLDTDSVRLKLRIPVRTISNYDELESGRYTPDIPLFYHVTGEQQYIELQPLGTTLSRISTFPQAENRRTVPVVYAQVLGPYPHDFLLPLSKLDTPESDWDKAVDLQPNRDGFYDLIHHFRVQGELAAVIRFRLYSDIETDAVLAVKAADRAEFKLNGEDVGQIEAVGCGEFHCPTFLPVKLQRGHNFLIAIVADGPKPSQYRDSWGVAIECFVRE